MSSVPTKQKLEDGLKKVRAEKPKENFFILQFDGRMVIPAKVMPDLLKALEGAEKLPRYHSDWKEGIQSLRTEELTITPLSRQQYEDHKLAALLGISPYDLEQARRKVAEEEATTPSP